MYPQESEHTMANTPIYNHPLMGREFTYRADLPAYDPDAPENHPGHPDWEPGTLIIGPGMRVGVKQVFRNWNDVAGLDMMYVYCFATGHHIHVTPFDLGLTPMTYDVETHENGTAQRLVVSGGEPFGDALVVERHDGWYYMGPLDAAKRLMFDEYGEDITEVATEPNQNGTVIYTVSEHRGGEGSGPENPNQWGRSTNLDEAWRYLIGADFGPADDDGYDEPRLRALLAQTSLRMERESRG